MLALLLAALSPFAAAPAQAQTTIWSATLTAGRDGSAYGCSNNTSELLLGRCSTLLTDDEFTSSGTAYTIRDLYWDIGSNVIFLELNGITASAARTALSGLTLNVDGTALAFSDAGLRGGGTNQIYWSYDPATDWADGTTVQLSLTGLPPGAVRFSFGGGGRDNGLQFWIRPPSGPVTGYDVHYTSTFPSEVADDAPASGSDPTFAWVVWNDPVHAGSQQRVITGLTNGLEYRVRVRAKNSAGAGPWTVHRHTVGLRVARLRPDPNLLAGLTINDGTRDLKLQPNRANAVGFGGPGIYAVFVDLGIRELLVTPTFTEANAGASAVNVWSYDASSGEDTQLSRTIWGSSESGTARSVTLLSWDGVTRLRIQFTTNAAARHHYTVYVYHTSGWDTLQARLKKLEMLAN